MPELPRFSRGELGRLRFSDLNNAFDLLDQLRPLLTLAAQSSAALQEDFILARVLGAGVYGDHEWEEVVVAPTTFQRAWLTFEVRDGGRVSKSRFNPDFEPAYAAAPFGSGLGGQVAARIAPDTVCLLRKMKRMDGRIYWLAVTQPTTVWPAMIINASQLPAFGNPPKVYRWRYQWREAYVDLPTNSWQIKPNGLYGLADPQDAGLGLAFNGAEVNGVIGAGGSGAGGSETNARIENGVVVPMSMVGGVPWFSLANTLSVSCGVP